jgi:hypothetical protein
VDAPTRPKKTGEAPPTGLAGVPLLARAIIGAFAGAILGKVASAVVGYLLYFVMILSVLNRPVGLDSWFMGMAALPPLGWTFGALPGALSGIATLASRKLIAVFTGCLASLAYAIVEINGGNPDLGGFIAVVTGFGAVVTGLSIYLAVWLPALSLTRQRKAA